MHSPVLYLLSIVPTMRVVPEFPWYCFCSLARTTETFEMYKHNYEELMNEALSCKIFLMNNHLC